MFFRRRPAPLPVDVITGYAHWAAAYPARPHNPLMEAEQQAMLDLLPTDLSGQSCLDLACGSGRYSCLLVERRASRVVGLDYSAAMLRQARRQAGQPAGWVHGSFLTLPLPSARFEVVVCGLAVGHTARLAPLVAEMARVLRPGGLLLYSDFHPIGERLGWRRTFTAADGVTFSLPHHPHQPGDHLAACRQAGLSLEAMAEPRLAQPGPSARFQDVPVVLVIRARRD